MTPQSARLLRFLRDWYRSHDHGPSFEEAAKGIGLASKSSICRYLEVLVPDGYVERVPGRRREIRLTAKGMAAVAEPVPRTALDNALHALFESGLIKEDESTGVAHVRMDALGAVELSWRGDA